MQDHLELHEIAEIALKVQRQVGDLNRVIYIAHVHYGKSIDDIAKQLNRDPSDIEHRVDYVAKRIKKALESS